MTLSRRERMKQRPQNWRVELAARAGVESEQRAQWLVAEHRKWCMSVGLVPEEHVSPPLMAVPDPDGGAA